MNIIIGADLAIDEKSVELFANGNLSSVLDEKIIEIIKEADYRIFNLEGPLTDSEIKIQKCGPCFKAPTCCIKGINNLKVDLFTLANNHILDYGEEGLKDTVSVLDENGIAFTGAGKNINNARKPFVLSLGNLKIGVYACVENEFSIATKDTWGSNPYDALTVFDDVEQIKNNVDYLLVLYHGGKEYYRYPSPGLQKICRKFITEGADMVICQHSHCIGAEEIFLGKKIIYGQGNFFMQDEDNEFYNSGLLISLEFEEGKNNIRYIPIVKNNRFIRIANDKEKEEILNEFRRRSNDIKSEKFVDEKYAEFSKNNIGKYYKEFKGNGVLIRILSKILKGRFNNKLYSRKAKLRLYDFINCEAHRELIINGINKDAR